MYITLNEKEFELLKELELEEKYCYSCVDNFHLTYDLCGSELRALVADVLEYVPLLNDKQEQKLLCDLAWRIVVTKI